MPGTPDIYVDTNATGQGNGTPDSPYRTIGQAVRNAQPGDFIGVAPGDYNEEVVINNKEGLRLEAGWIYENGRWRNEWSGSHSTMLKKTGGGAAVRLRNAPKTIIQGFYMNKGLDARETGPEQTMIAPAGMAPAIHINGASEIIINSLGMRNGLLIEISANVRVNDSLAIGPVALQIDNSSGVTVTGSQVVGATETGDSGVGVVVGANSGVSLVENMIFGEAVGIDHSGSGDIKRNRIFVKNPDGAVVAIELRSGGIEIENNVLWTEGTDTTAIRENGGNAVPASLLNNEFHGNNPVFYHSNQAGDITDQANLNSIPGIPSLGGNDYVPEPPAQPCHLSEDLPCMDIVFIPMPLSRDLDGDGMDDRFEEFHFGDIYTSNGTVDSDGDGLTDLQEYQLGTNPTDIDSDQDGETDGEEVASGASNPLVGEMLAQPDLYVDVQYQGVTNNGTATAPFATIADALALATPGTRIAIAEGAYFEQINITGLNRLILFGGWRHDGNGVWTRDDMPDPSLTQIGTVAVSPAVELNGANRIRIDGLSLVGGVYAVNSNDLMYTGNIAIGPEPVRIENCVGAFIDRNQIVGADDAPETTVGIIVSNSSATIRENLIHANTTGIQFNGNGFQTNRRGDFA